MSDEPDDREPSRRPPPPWGDEITPFTEVCGGQYVLLNEIARGDLSIVYRAKPAGSRDVLAFKLVQPRYVGDETQVRRFRREAELLRRIEHPNVVRLVDHGTIEDGRDFVALELLAGRTLREALSEAERMPPERTCRIARQVGRALRAMHKAGVIHRDLTPENILLIGPEDGERVKLVDFSQAGDVGAPARRVKGQSEDSGEHEGPSYRPPEQVRKRPPQPTMDVFALGVIMFEMLTGQHPFVQAQDKVGQTIRSKAFDAPEVLLGLVGECIETKPKDRPRSMDEVLERLDKALLWMGVVPHEVADGSDEDERTQPYEVADPGHDDEEARARRAAAAASAARPRTSSKGSTVAGEVVLSASDPFDEDVIKTQRRPIYRSPEPEPEDDDAERMPTQRRRVGSDRPKDSASWDDGWEDDRRGRDSEDDSWEEARSGGTTSESWDDEEGRRGSRDSSSGSWDESRSAGRARRARDESWEGRREPPRGSSQSRDESWEGRREPPRGSPRARDESGDDGRPPRTRDPSRDGSTSEERRRPRRNADGPVSDSIPNINIDDLREGNAPKGPRFVVDTVAWTKQQPSAKPEKERRSHVKKDDERSSSRKGKGSRRPTESRRPGGSRKPTNPRARPPTAAQAPVDPIQTLPRWVLPLLVMVIVVLAYAVWVVWTQ